MDRLPRSGKGSGWISRTGAGASVTLGRQKTVLPSEEVRFRTLELAREKWPLFQKGEGWASIFGGLFLESGLGKADSRMPACFGWF